MINGGRALGADTDDLGFQRGDTGIKLGHRQRIEVLAAEHRQRIVAPARMQFIEVHVIER